MQKQNQFFLRFLVNTNIIQNNFFLILETFCQLQIANDLKKGRKMVQYQQQTKRGYFVIVF